MNTEGKTTQYCGIVYRLLYLPLNSGDGKFHRIIRKTHPSMYVPYIQRQNLHPAYRFSARVHMRTNGICLVIMILSLCPWQIWIIGFLRVSRKHYMNSFLMAFLGIPGYGSIKVACTESGGTGFVRINQACHRSILKEALQRLKYLPETGLA